MRYLGKFTPVTRTFAMSVGPDVKASAAALGKLLADKLVMPASALVNPEEFYSSNCKDNYSDNLFYILESAVIDINKVEVYKRMFWFARYKVLHNSFVFNTLNGGFLDILGVTQTIPVEDIEYFNKNSAKIARLYNGFSKWFEEIDKIVENERK